MPFDKELIEPSVERFRRERDRYAKLADRVAEICREDICEQNGIRAQVTFRVKSTNSLRGKLKRFSERDNKNYAKVEDVFNSISDFAGVRIAAYRLEDCNKIVEYIKEKFRWMDGDIIPDVIDRHKDDRSNFYRAIHVQVQLEKDELVGIYDNVDDISCEIQICTMMAHVWNEIEHDIGYKPSLGNPSEDEKKFLQILGNIVRIGDDQISLLLKENAERIKYENNEDTNIGDKEFRDIHDFINRMQDFSDGTMTEFSDNSGQLFDLIDGIGLDTPNKLKETLSTLNNDSLKAEANEFNKYLETQDASQLRINPESSDLILLKLLKERMNDVLGHYKGKIGQGRGRPNRLYRLAKRYMNWEQSHHT